MSREILFKAKRIDNGEWVEGSLLQTTAVSLKSFIVESSCYTFDKWDWNECVQVDTDTICQYTGLTDKNGNKIWENDIVMLDDEFWVVKWSDNDAQFTIEDDATIEHFGNVWGADCEVYGNLFDNPELIRGAENE